MLFSVALLFASAAAFNPASVRFATKASKVCRAGEPVARIGYLGPGRAGELMGARSTNMDMMYGGGMGMGMGYGGYGGGYGMGMGGYGMNGMSRARQMMYDGSMYSAFGNQGMYGGGYGMNNMYGGYGGYGGMGGYGRYGGMSGYGGYGGYGMGMGGRYGGGYGMNSMYGGYGGYGMGMGRQYLGEGTPTHDYFLGMARSRRSGLPINMQDHEYRHHMMYR